MKSLTRCRILLVGLTALVAAEVLLRAVVGLGNPVLFQKDPETGYRFKPNQKITRFGKRIEYNQYSQRSEPITAEKPEGTIRILMVGDSVLNGGNPVDQSQTITQLLENKIEASGQSAEVLNASASGWGIGNQWGYLCEFGTFHSDIVILLISSHNLIQSTSSGDRVGQNPFYPDHSPLLAIQEAIGRYLLPMLGKAMNADRSSTNLLIPTEHPFTASEINQQFQRNMELLKKSISLVQAQRVPIDVLFTPNRKDLIPAFVTPDHKLKFFQFLNTQKVSVFDAHQAWSISPTTAGSTYFRDIKHLTEQGNEAIARLIFQQLCSAHQLKKCAKR